MLDKMITIRSNTSARPDSSDCETRLIALRDHIGPIAQWAVSTENVSTTFVKDPAFENLLSLAVLESGDAYEAVKWLDEVARWEVTTALVYLFDRLYNALEPITLIRERDWVMRNGVRFPADVRDTVSVLVGEDVETGMVNTVERALARGLVDFGYASMWVNAEDVVGVLP